MSVLLITYDLNRESSKTDYNGFYRIIKGYSWAKLSESSYVISTNETPKQVWEKLSPYADSNDYLTVLTITTGSWWSRNQQATQDWLRANLS